MAETVRCPICGSSATGGHKVGDSTVYECPNCGGYRLAGTVEKLLAIEGVHRPSPDAFRALVRAKRGNSTEYPVITSHDLGKP